MNDTKTLSELEQRFCLIYTNGPAPYSGNAVRCYALVFENTAMEPKNEAAIEISLKVHDLMMKDEIKDFIDQLSAQAIINATTLRPRLTQTLLNIMDECSTAEYRDKWGTSLSPAALRAVSVNAASKLAEMYGIKEDIAHKISIEGGDGNGITFNLIAPAPEKKPEDILM